MNRADRRRWVKGATSAFIKDGGSAKDASRIAEAVLSASIRRRDGTVTEDDVIEELRRRGQLIEEVTTT